MPKEHAFLPFALTAEQIRDGIMNILQRSLPAPGRRQVPFNRVETLLCYGLFYVIDPHRYGGANISSIPPVVKTLATFFRRSPGSLTSKMLNLDGSRPHSAREEPWLFASCAANPNLYRALYDTILGVARSLSIPEDVLPDFLPPCSPATSVENLVGQDDLPQTTATLLRDQEEQIHVLEKTFALSERLTEKMVEQKIRLAQHRFALAVLHNCGNTCVFCGFAPHSLGERNGLLRASHIKPWAMSTDAERVDVRNGVAACPIHDAAFDAGYLTISRSYLIQQARILQESEAHDEGVHPYFGAVLHPSLLLPPHAHKPGQSYLRYHYKHIFRQ